MCRVEETVASICGAFVSELVVRETKCNKTEFCMMGEYRGGETAPRNSLGLDDASNNYDANSGMWIVDVLHELHHRLTAVYHRVH